MCLGDKKMEGMTHMDDSHRGDAVIGNNNPLAVGKSQDRASSVGSVCSPPVSAGSAPEIASNSFGFVDMPLNLSSLKNSPRDAVPSLNCNAGNDELSLPKRSRLGWGQGLAKYERRKVGGVDEKSKGTASLKKDPGIEGDSDQEDRTPSLHVSSPLSWSIPCSSVTWNASPDSLKNFVDVKRNPSQAMCLDYLPGKAVPLTATTAPELGGFIADSSIAESYPSEQKSVQCSWSPASEEPDSCVVGPNPSGMELEKLGVLSTGVSRNDRLLLGRFVHEMDAFNKHVFSGESKEAISERVEKVEVEIDCVEKELSKLILEMEKESSSYAGSEALGMPLPSVSPDKQKLSTTEHSEEPHDSKVSAGLESSSLLVSEVVPISPCQKYLNVETEVPKCEGSQISSDAGNDSRELAEMVHGGAHQTKDYDLVEPTKQNSLVTESPGEEVPEGSRLEYQGGFAFYRFGAHPIEDQLNHVLSVILENRALAKQALEPFLRFLLTDADGKILKLYASPQESPVWVSNEQMHMQNCEILQGRLTDEKRSLRFKERVLALKYRILKDTCVHEKNGLCQRKERLKAVRKWEAERRTVMPVSVPCQRSSARPRSMLSGLSRPDAGLLEPNAMRRLLTETTGKHLRHNLKMPAMIINDKERFFSRFLNWNGLVEDPVSFEEERKTINPWTAEEKKIFLEKFAAFGKDFSKIASSLEHKTTADCVEFYYRNQKSEDFERIRRRQQLKKRRDYSMTSAAYLATTTPASGRHHESNGTRVEALTMAAAVAFAASKECSKSARSNLHRVTDRSRASTLDSDTVHTSWRQSACLKESKCASGLASVSIGATSRSPSNATLSNKRIISKNGAGILSFPAKSENFAHPYNQKGSRTVYVRSSAMKVGEGVDPQWTDSEKGLFTDAILKFGKDFKNISQYVGSRSQTECKTYFSKTRKRLRLDELVELFQETSNDGIVAGKVSEPSRKKKVVGSAEGMKQADFVDSKIEPAEDVPDISMPTNANEPVELNSDFTMSQSDTCQETEKLLHDDKGNSSLSGTGNYIQDKSESIDHCVIGSDCDLVGCLSSFSNQVVDRGLMKNSESSMEGQDADTAVGLEPSAGTTSKLVDALEDLSAVAPLSSSIDAVSSTDKPAPDIVASFTVPHPMVLPTSVGQNVVAKETGAKSNPFNETKTRREPTSWTQEEKDKFLDIIKQYGKDWVRLQECLPGKSMTQIKTYFQNSKVKLGFCSVDGVGTLSPKGNGNCKRKIEESDMGNNGDLARQMNQRGTSGLVADPLSFALFSQSTSQSGEDPAAIQNIIRRMYSVNDYAPPIPGHFFPLLQPGALQVLPCPNPQSPVLSSSQKSQQHYSQPKLPLLSQPSLVHNPPSSYNQVTKQHSAGLPQKPAELPTDRSEKGMSQPLQQAQPSQVALDLQIVNECPTQAPPLPVVVEKRPVLARKQGPGSQSPAQLTSSQHTSSQELVAHPHLKQDLVQHKLESWKHVGNLPHPQQSHDEPGSIEHQSHGPSLTLFRIPPGSPLVDNELMPSQVVERAPSKLKLLPSDSLHRPPPLAHLRRTQFEPQQLHLSDVKLFGQSLLSQPQSSIVQSCSPHMFDMQSSWQVAPAAAGTELTSTPKLDPLLYSSSAGRGGLFSSDELPSWPLSSTGSVDVWSRMTGSLHGVAVSKPEHNELESHSVQQEGTPGEIQNADGGLFRNIAHSEQGGIQLVGVSEGFPKQSHSVNALDLIGRSGRELNQVVRRNFHGSQSMSRFDDGTSQSNYAGKHNTVVLLDNQEPQRKVVKEEDYHEN